jgi:hypothetical protein
LLVLAAAEGLMHSEAFLYRLRGVFAVGRAFDKVLYVERHPPHLLVLGNSRVDNGIDPVTLAGQIGHGTTAFNPGLPGAGATAIFGILQRFDARGLLGQGGVERVLIGLDEGLVQGDDSLGYEVFFADGLTGQTGITNYLRTHIHLWGYADNLKKLREPANLLLFAEALLTSVDPIGGSAARRLGYRPGFSGANQDAEQVARQQAGSTMPPDQGALADFWAMLELLRARGVQVEVVFPPLLNQRVLYLAEGHPAAGPYRTIRRDLAARGIRSYALAGGAEFSATEFVNAGHLNDQGAQRFSASLGDAMARSAVAGLVRVTAP